MRLRRPSVYRGVALGVAVGLMGFAPHPLLGQSSMQKNQLRIGLTLGSISFAGLNVEYFFSERRSVDVNLGSWSLRDISTSAVVKQYVGGGDARAYVSLGLWTVLAWQEEGFGSALILRAPIGLEFEPFDNGSLGVEISLSRALLVNRSDPEDDTPPADRIVPLPGFYFKWASRDR